MKYLNFEPSEGAEGVTTLEAVASTRAAEHAAVMSEALSVLDWARRTFPTSEGSVEDGQDWDHDLSARVDDGHWFEVALTFTASAAFLDAFVEEFGPFD